MKFVPTFKNKCEKILIDKIDYEEINSIDTASTSDHKAEIIVLCSKSEEFIENVEFEIIER